MWLWNNRNLWCNVLAIIAIIFCFSNNEWSYENAVIFGKNECHKCSLLLKIILRLVYAMHIWLACKSAKESLIIINLHYWDSWWRSVKAWLQESHKITLPVRYGHQKDHRCVIYRLLKLPLLKDRRYKTVSSVPSAVQIDGFHRHPFDDCFTVIVPPWPCVSNIT